MHDDYTGKGIDQLQRCIDLIKSNPSDRRIIMSAWNPAGTVERKKLGVKVYITLMCSCGFVLWLCALG